MPSCAPRPVPTSSAVGVARPRAHRAGDDEHRDGRGHRGGGREAEQQPDDERDDGDREDDRHEDARDAVGEALHVRLARLRLFDEPRHLRELGVVADARRADDEPPAGVDGRADHGIARADLDGHRLAGDHRGVDRRRARDDDAVGRDLLARAHDELVADAQLDAIGMRRLDDAPSAGRRTATSFAPSSSSARSAAPARRLERTSK